MKNIYSDIKELNLNRLIVLLIILISFNQRIFAQKISKIDSVIYRMQENKANRYFELTAYIRAIHIYKDLVNKGYQNDSLERNLAVACYKISDGQNAEFYLRRIIDRNKYSPEELYFYIQTLKFNGKYEEADIWLNKYLSMNPNDKKATEQKGTVAFINKLKEKEHYKIEEVPFNSVYSDFGATPYQGHLQFTSARNDQSIIRFQDSWKETPFYALYSIKSDQSSAVRITSFGKKFNTIYHDGPACFDTTENEVFVTRNNYKHRIPRKGKEGINNLKILTAKKNMIGTWSSLKELPFNSNDYSCGHPSLSPDGKTLYFASNMPGGKGGTDIYYVTRTENGWSEPKNIGSDINTEGDEMTPFIHKNGHLYFSSTGHQGMGGLDIFEAIKNPDGSYKVINMGCPLNSSFDDFSFYLLPDGISGYMASNRPGGKGDDDIYKFTNTDKNITVLDLEGTVIDALNGNKLDSAKVELILEDGTPVQIVNTGNLNQFGFQIKPDLKYKVKVTRKGYLPSTIDVDPSKRAEGEDLIKVIVPLKREAEWGIYGNVFVLGTNEIVPQVNLHINKAGDAANVTTYITTMDGFRVRLEPNTKYDLVFEKRGFLTKRAEYTTEGREPGYVDVNEFIEIKVEKLVLNKIIDIPNILYDLGKWNIRPDAAVELDKVVQFLKDNPYITVELGSHTDSRGSTQSNQILSQQRAQSAVEYIVSHGIDGSRISAKGYGESKLKNRCADGVICSEAEHQQNRRTEIKVLSF
ncbi:MAG: OmpA family protein [Bacteroidales bacterium]|nr:OmpA family protein [Bacteroidales bacterium]